MIQFEQQHEAKIQADKAKAMAEFTAKASRIPGPGPGSLRRSRMEAAQLCGVSSGASPAEQAQIEQRARQLLQQLP